MRTNKNIICLERLRDRIVWRLNIRITRHWSTHNKSRSSTMLSILEKITKRLSRLTFLLSLSILFIKHIVKLFNKIYISGNTSEDWLKSIFIRLLKKHHPKKMRRSQNNQHFGPLTEVFFSSDTCENKNKLRTRFWQYSVWF